MKWSDFEIKYLTELSKKVTCKQAAEALDRTYDSVKCKAADMGLSFQRYGQAHHSAKHSNHDVDLVRQLRAASMPEWLIAKKMEMPQSTVNHILNHNSRNVC